MSLKINNDTITTSDLTGGNSNATYFSNLTQLVPNKTGYKLFGSPLQRQQLKRMVNSTLPYNINYTPKFSNIVNCGDNTELFTTYLEDNYLYTGGSASKYIVITNKLPLETATSWEISTIYIHTQASSYPTIIGYSSGDIGNTPFLQGIPTRLYLFMKDVNGNNLINGYTGYSLSYGMTYTIKLGWTGTKYYLNVNDTDVWTTNNSNATKCSSNTQFFNYGTGDSSHYGTGPINMTKTIIKINGEIWFNGATAVEDVDFTNNNCTISTETTTTKIPDPFTFSFDIDSSAFTQGTKYLLEHPNLIKIITQNNTLYFNFPWKSNKWYYLPNSILIEGINNISLSAPQTSSLNIPYYAYSYNNEDIFTTTDHLTLDTKLYNSQYELLGYPSEVAESGLINCTNNNCSDLGNGVYQGGSDKYISFDSSILANKNNWELVIKYTYNGGGVSYACIIAPNGNTSNFLIQTSSSVLKFYAAKTSAWDLFNGDNLNLTLTTGNTYFLKLTYDSTTGYAFYCKSTKEASWGEPTWTSDITDKIQFNLPYQYFLNFGGFTSSQYANGPIDLSETYIIAEGVRTNFYQFGDELTYDNNIYIRNQERDITRTVETSNTIKLSVNSHNFTLVSPSEDIPTITTGVLGYKEDLVF